MKERSLGQFLAKPFNFLRPALTNHKGLIVGSLGLFIFVAGFFAGQQITSKGPKSSPEKPRLSPANLNEKWEMLSISQFSIPVGELVRNRDGRMYWLQSGRKYYVPNVDVIAHMKSHGVRGWEGWRSVDDLHSFKEGPVFYYKTRDSNGLLLGVSSIPATYLSFTPYFIHNAQYHEFHDAFSFENYPLSDGFPDISDVIHVTEEIACKEFSEGYRIHITPTLLEPTSNSQSLSIPITLEWKANPNTTWIYQCQIAEDKGYSNLFYDTTLCTPALILEDCASGTYFWRVRAVKAGRPPSEWSDTWSFGVAKSQGNER